ncbi:MAG: LD-carboxypeptidase [Defluviitaleaceae bacterium]|nr:LD-carboxypeptidase [Defluviitaleaceae bacterium]
MRPLKYRDKVALIAPSSEVNEDNIKKSQKIVKKLGLVPVLGTMGKTDEEKAQDFMWAFTEDDIKGVFCIRGGYGSSRLIPFIDWNKITPKIFLGYSDITALHLAISKFCGFPTFHGAMPGVDLVRKSQISPLFKKIKRCNIIGGNLSIVTSSLGTPYEIDTLDKILFLEEVNESIYKIERMITQLRHANKLHGDILLGHFFDENKKRIPTKTIANIIGKPCKFYPAGHASPNKVIIL